MQQLNAHQFKDLYDRLGIEVNDLGCVMLDTEPIPKPVMYQYEIPEAFYTAKNPDHYWINGYMADDPHVTLLYGLLTPAYEQPENIAEVMEGWELPSVTIKDFGYFPSPAGMEDESYYCIIGNVEVTPKLKEGMERLEFLPHINTYAEYKPHLTIAYIQKDEKLRDRIINDMNRLFAGKVLLTKPELNLGGKK